MSDIIAFLRKPLPVRWRVLTVLALYGIYLPLSGYLPAQYRFDAAEYWELSLKFTQHGHFSVLAFDEPLRGYLGPMLVLPARLLCHLTGWPMLAGARVAGAGWAALLYGIAIPALWAQVAGRPLTSLRWLAMLALAFLFWRDYFNFTLSDVPALTALVLGLVALGRPGWLWAGAAGVLVAAALNIRPVYIAILPGVVWLLLAARLPVSQQLRRAFLLCTGAALVLLPQWRINQQHFRRNTPLVLARLHGGGSLYLRQLAWGTRFQRYETSLIPEVPRSLIYADPAGQRALAAEPGGDFFSYGQYLRFVLRQPLASSWRYLRHLFNGLDSWFPTPYPTRLHPPGQAVLRLLNYGLLGLGMWLIALSPKGFGNPKPVGKTSRQIVAAVLLALLLPCALALPTLIESRFILPLHLLLLTGISGTWQPVASWQQLGSPLRRLMVLGLALVWLWGCWQLSEDTARQLRPPSEAPQE